MSVSVDSQGQTWVTENGRWRPANEAEVRAIETGPVEAFGQGLAQQGGDVLDLFSLPIGARVPGHADAVFDRIAQRGVESEVRNRFHPEANAASIAAGIALDPLNLLIPRGGSLLRQAGSATARQGRGQVPRMAERVAARRAQAASIADDSAGAAAVDFENIPPSSLGRMWQWIGEEFTDPQTLTKAQRDGIALGDSIGFSWLPGQQEGNNLLIAGVKSHPILAGAFDSTLSANRLGFEQAWLRAIGSDAREFTRSELGQRMRAIGDGFDNIGGRISEVSLPPEVAQRISTVRKLEPDLDILLKELGEVGADVTLTGEQLMGIRSLLNKSSSQLWRGNNANPMRAEFVDTTIGQIDDLIESKIGLDGMREWQTLRSQWRNAKLLEDPGVINKPGTLNPTVIDNKLRSKGAAGSTVYRRNDAQFPGLDRPTQEAYQWTRTSNLFGDNLGDSGTASRQYMQKLLSGDFKGIVQTMMLKRYLERTATRGISKQGGRRLDELDSALKEIP